MRRPISLVSAGLVAFAIMTAASLGAAAPASAATIAPTTTCNNALGNGGAVCEVTVVNTITPTGGSAVVTVRECTGSAGVPSTTCTNTTTPLNQPVTAVTDGLKATKLLVMTTLHRSVPPPPLIEPSHCVTAVTG
jgi:hypothetical protein